MHGERRIIEVYIPYLLNRADQAMSRRFHDELAGRGIQTSDWRVLATLKDEGALSVGELSDRIRVPQPTITHAIKRLEDRGQVERYDGIADRRQRFADLTYEGHRVVSELMDLALAYELQALSAFDDPDAVRLELRSVLTRLIEGLDQD